MSEELFIDAILKKELDAIKKKVTKKDRDFVLVIDGEEGSGKSVLAMQVCKYLDSSFGLNDITFNAEQFIERIKSNKQYKALLLDEAFSSASSRSALSEVNKSMIAVGTEMRQKNQFIVLCLPTFFDLDKYFALWRCRALIHVYFDKEGGRGRYVIFPKTAKKMLYINGKKTYNYAKPKSPYPPCRFNNFYVVDENKYREKKSLAFKKRIMSNQAKRWKGERDGMIKEMYHNLNIGSAQFEKIFLKWGLKPLSQREICRIIQLEQEG